MAGGKACLLFGASGQLGGALQDLLADQGWQVDAPGRDRADLAEPAGLARLVEAHPAPVVFNAAAYTAVDPAETEEALAARINTEAPGQIAAGCARSGKIFIHVSTDYVFGDHVAGEGHARPWREDDMAAPLNAYGRTKLAGERAVAAAGGAHAILRTSWVFSPAARNFLSTMLRLGQERASVSVVGDQTSCPTPAAALAAAMIRVSEGLSADPGKSGVYHFSGIPPVSRADFARAIFAAAGLSVQVEDITSAAFGAPAPRPAYSALDTARIKAVFDIEPPDWREALRSMIRSAS